MNKFLVVLLVAGILAAALLAQGASAEPYCTLGGCSVIDTGHYGAHR
jgi:hypothetical protein